MFLQSYLQYPFIATTLHCILVFLIAKQKDFCPLNKQLETAGSYGRPVWKEKQPAGVWAGKSLFFFSNTFKKNLIPYQRAVGDTLT